MPFQCRGRTPERDDIPYLDDFFRAVALPPLRPAAFFWAVVPPCFELPPEPDDLPPRLDAPGELAMRAARSLDIPLSFSASYCLSFLTLGRVFGISTSWSATGALERIVPAGKWIEPFGRRSSERPEVARPTRGAGRWRRRTRCSRGARPGAWSGRGTT